MRNDSISLEEKLWEVPTIDRSENQMKDRGIGFNFDGFFKVLSKVLAERL